MRAYLAITADLSELEAHTRTDRIGENGYLLATDTSGALVFQSDLMSTRLGLPQQVVTQTINAAPHSPPPLTTINGEQALIEARKLLPDLYLFAVLPHAELLAAGRHVAVIVAAITLITILITSVCLFLALHVLVIRPLQRLESLSKDIGRGQLDIKHKLRSRDEIGALANAFQDMAHNLRHSHEQIRFVAYHDSLTGLPNRTMFREYLNQVIADARRNDRQFALLFLDVDDFKRVNDTLGHQAGDRRKRDVLDQVSAARKPQQNLKQPRRKQNHGQGEQQSRSLDTERNQGGKGCDKQHGNRAIRGADHAACGSDQARTQGQ